MSTVLHIHTVGGKKKIRLQHLQESQMKKLSTVLNNSLEIYGSII